nr:hypothetical protein [Tanacetum cinerariifolium]
MLNKDNYVSWSSRLLRYAKSKPNEKLLVNSIKNGPYVRRMIHELGDPNSVPPIAKSTHDQTYDELIEKETAKKIWLRVEKMMTGSTIRAQEKKAKLFNEWERFRSSEGESIESYYNRFSKLMNDFYREKHFPEKISSNLKFLNSLQPEWKRYDTDVYQTKDLYEVDYTQLSDFLKFNQAEVDEIRAERLAKTQDLLAQMENSHNPYNYSIARNHNGYNTIQNVKNQVVQNAVQNPSIQNVANQNGLIVVSWITNQNANKTGNGNVLQHGLELMVIGIMRDQIRCYKYRGLGHYDRNCIVRPRRSDAAHLHIQLRIAHTEEAGIQLQAEIFDLMAAAWDIKEINANCILMANL